MKPSAPATAAPPPPEPGFFDALTSTFRSQRDDMPGHHQSVVGDAYIPLMQQLEGMGWKHDDLLVNPERKVPGAADYSYSPDKIWLGVDRERRRAQQLGRPDPFPKLPQTRAEFDASWQGKETQRQGRDADVSSRSGWTPWLLGSIGAGFTDPVNLATMPLGGPVTGTGGRAVAGYLLREFLINAGTEVVEQPLINQERDVQGRAPMTLGERIEGVTLAGLTGSAFAGTHMAVGKGIDMATPLDWKLARQLKRAVPDAMRTPQQQAAINVIERGAEVDASNPGPNTYDGLAAHSARLQDTMGVLDSMPLAAAPVARPLVAAEPARSAVPAPAEPSASTQISMDDALGFIVDDLEGGPQLVTDSGGLTKYGISANAHPGVDVANLSRGQAMEIYRRDYLGALDRTGLSPAAQLVALDAKINHRSGFAEQLIRESGGDPAKMIAMRRAEYARLIAENPAKYGRYANGWENRLQKIERKIGLKPGEAGAAAASAPTPLPERTAAMDAAPVEAVLPGGMRPEVMRAGLPRAIEPVIGDLGRSLNDIGGLAAELGVPETDLRTALDDLTSEGKLIKTKGGLYRRPAVQSGPEDMVRFLSRRGGLSPDGFSEAQRLRNETGDNPPKGHDLKNTGNLDHFVPGTGPLLRKTGMGLDEAGEMLWGAGYFGPVDSTPRPTEAELITLLDQVIGKKEKRYSFNDQAPDAKAPPEERYPGFQSLGHFEQVRGQWEQAAKRVLGRDLTDDEFGRALNDMRREPSQFERDVAGTGYGQGEHLDLYVERMINRELDAALEDAWLELEDPVYDFGDDFAGTGSDQAGRAGAGGEGSAADPGNPRAGEQGTGNGTGAGESGRQSLSPAALDAAEAAGTAGPVIFNEAHHKSFDDPDGDGTRAVAESLWHDIETAQKVEWAQREALTAGFRARVPDDIAGEVYAEMGTLGPFLMARDGKGRIVTWQSANGELAINQKPRKGELALGDFVKAVRAGRDPEGRAAAMPAASGATEFQLRADDPLAGHLIDLDDGKGERSIADIAAELDADEAAIKAIGDCLS